MIITRTQEAGDAIPGNKSAAQDCEKCKHILKEHTENGSVGRGGDKEYWHQEGRQQKIDQ